MNLIVFGINHKTAPVEVREKLAIPEKALGDNLRLLEERAPGLREKVVLSTCNRTEIYARVSDVASGVDELKRFLCGYHEVDRAALDKAAYVLVLEDAVEHLFKVASSLDSMIVGEPQILGQVKGAYRAAREYSATGAIINRLFEQSFNVAKRIRTETGIAENAVSVSFAAVELAKKIFGDLEGKTALLIGAGEMIELAVKHLMAQGVETVLVANRTYDRAKELAVQFNGEAVKFDHLHEELKRCDIVISSTGAPHFVVRKDLAEKVIGQRQNRPMFFIDIAVPRDIEPSVNEIDNCYLYNIDDLHQVVEANMVERAREAQRAEEIVKSEVEQFFVWLDRLEMAPTIIALRQNVEAVRKAEMEKTLGRLAALSPEDKEAIDRMTQSMINKIIHHPIANLKRKAESEEGHNYLKAVRYLFGLDK
ncbi:MAG: glutamyl-tRNA reductase [Nitrospinota bacterium]|nr:glutamyl-tRNA reductase [Nitrospinota bacterium]MDH5679260.1 glutamyl-tRNA reductase [Nitrospinota bacterium]MDH5757297.1 glutamyl-tRNA reductase [Nitrospinota bacterium]